jgi:hypothetical protein
MGRLVDHINRLLDILSRSKIIAFALLFAGAFTFYGQHRAWWPFTLLTEQLGWVMFAMLLGAGVLLANFLAWLPKLGLLLYSAVELWWIRQNVMSRLPRLTIPERSALLWIAHNPKEQIHGSPLEEPFRGLIREGFLARSEDSGFSQGFEVNRKIYKNKAKIGESFTSSIHTAIVQGEAPWRRRVRHF